jgi:hypothetical protein
MIDITFDLSQAEFSEAQQMWCPKELKKLPGRTLYQIISIIFGGFIGWSFQYLPAWLIGALCLSMLANVSLYLWRKKAIRRYQYSANAELMESVKVHIDETGYRNEKSTMCGGWIAWDGFNGWRESKNIFVLGRNLTFISLPKTAMSSAQQDELRTLLNSHLGAAL